MIRGVIYKRLVIYRGTTTNRYTNVQVQSLAFYCCFHVNLQNIEQIFTTPLKHRIIAKKIDVQTSVLKIYI